MRGEQYDGIADVQGAVYNEAEAGLVLSGKRSRRSETEITIP